MRINPSGTLIHRHLGSIEIGARQIDQHSSSLFALLTIWLAALCVTACAVAPALAQVPPANDEIAAEQLQQEFTDPLSTLPQLVIRDAYTPANYGSNVETNQLLIRPLIPRIRTRQFLPLVQLVRPAIALVTVPNPRGGSRTEFGDMALFDLAALPWPNRARTGLLIGVGPTFVFPTASSKSAGLGAWQAGPALGVIYQGTPGLLIGFLAQNPISFAYTSSQRQPLNTFELQPVLALHLWRDWYLRSAEANWLIGWHHHSLTMLPLSLGVGRTFQFPGLPPMSLFVTGEWMLYHQNAPVAPQTTINFGIAVAFPELRPYWSK